MLFERIIAAFTFRREVYGEVEHDTSFTTTAWILVVVIALLSQIGANAGAMANGLVNWVIAAVVATIFAVLGFAVAAFITNAVGRALFNAEVTFEEMVRTMGLAYVWNIVGIIGIVSVFSEALTCVLAPIGCIAPILGLASTLIAVKEALDLEWGQTIITVIIGWIVQFIIMFVAGMLMGLMGLTAGAAMGIFGG